MNSNQPTKKKKGVGLREREGVRERGGRGGGNCYKKKRNRLGLRILKKTMKKRKGNIKQVDEYSLTGVMKDRLLVRHSVYTTN